MANSDPITREDLANLADAIGKGVSQGMAVNMPRPQKTFGEYLRTAKSATHPEGLINMHKFTRKSYQNGVPLDEERITNQAIDAVNAIVRPGRYIDRRVDVIINTDSGEPTVDIRYNNRTPDMRFENKNYWRSFLELVEKIVAEQDEILASEQANKTQGGEKLAKAQEERAARPADARSFGKSKAFQQALADAEARAAQE